MSLACKGNDIFLQSACIICFRFCHANYGTNGSFSSILKRSERDRKRKTERERNNNKMRKKGKIERKW